MSERLNVNAEIANKDRVICSFSGKVMYGRGIGKSLGFPTANLDLFGQHSQLLSGVYGVKVYFNNQEYTGVMNVGCRPTFNENKNSIHYEVHLFDFNQDLYGHNIDIKVCFFLREEISFSSIMDLVTQIKIDSDMAKTRFALFSS